MSRVARRKANRLFSNHMNRIYTVSSKIAKEFDRKSIPVTTFKNITDKAILKHGEGTNENSVEFLDKVNNVVKTIYNVGEQYAKGNSSDSIPLVYVKQMINTVNNAFKEGAKLVDKD